LETRWCKEPLVANAPQQLTQMLLLGLGDMGIDVLLRERLPCERRNLHREGLRLRRHLARHIGLRHRAFLDREHRLSCLALEDVDESELACLGDDVDVAAVLFQCEQLRRLRQVVVPQIVMHELVMPETLAGPRIERNETVREEIVANAIAAEEIESRGAERNERDAILLVDRELAPVVNAAGLLI